jgi:hypothetical protein
MQSRRRSGRQVSYRQAVTAYLPVPPSAAVVQRGGKTGQERERREFLRLLHVHFSLGSFTLFTEEQPQQSLQR